MMELLTSILAAVEAQNTRIATLTEQQKKLAGFVKVMDEETTRRLERIIAATAKLAREVTVIPVGKRAQRVRQPRQPDIRSAAAV